MPTTTTHRDPEVYRAYHRRRDRARRRERERLRNRLLVEVRAVIPRLAMEHQGIRSVHLFGSIVQPGRFAPGSDLDVAVEADSVEDEGPFARSLEEALEWRVDVRPLTGPICTAVETRGETVYERRDSRP